MPTPDLAVTALLRNLNDELDRKKMKKVEDLMLAEMQCSVHGRLGPRMSKQHTQISHWRGGGKLCGAIFMCNRRTWKECLGQCLFGLPIGKKGLVEEVIPGMKLFLFEYERRQLWGVFEAASYGGMNIIPNAYTGGSFPCQVRVKVPEECVALYEEEFCEAIRDNYFSPEKFHFDLSEKQVSHLISLFERKYLRAMHTNLLKYDEKRCISEGDKSNGGLPLLLANEASCLYSEDLLQHSLYSSSCQVMNGPRLLKSEDDRNQSYKNGESKTSRKSSGKGPLISLPNGAHDIVQSNVLSLSEDFSTGDMMLFPDNMSRLHSDRPITKSVWARISGCPKALRALESSQVKKSPEVTPVMTSPPKVCTIFEMDVEDDMLVEDQNLCIDNVSEEPAEEFSVGFKRRRATNDYVSANVDETPSKRRRKLTRPSFEDAADEHLAEQGKFESKKTPLPSANGALVFLKNTTAGIAEDSSGNISLPTELPMKSEENVCLSREASEFVSDPGEGIVRVDAPGCNQGNSILHSAHTICQPTSLDLNLPVEALLQNDQGVAIVLDDLLLLKDEKPCTTNATASQVPLIAEAKGPLKLEQYTEPINERTQNSVCEMQQESCCLALSLATQETVLHSRDGIHDHDAMILTDHQQNNESEVLVLVKDTEQDKTLAMDGPENFLDQAKQGGGTGGKVIENGVGCLGKEEQGFDLQQQPYISSERASLDLAPVDSLRASPLSLAPCTPAKDFLESSYSVSEQCDDRKGFFHDLARDIPLKLELGNGSQLPDVKLRSYDILHPEHASVNSCEREGDNAVVHDEPSDENQSRESNTISLDCTFDSNLLNQAELKSFLRGLQVSGVRLQLGASPCLILQLGDLAGSTSNMDRQDQGVAIPGQPEPS